MEYLIVDAAAASSRSFIRSHLGHIPVFDVLQNSVDDLPEPAIPVVIATAKACAYLHAVDTQTESPWARWSQRLVDCGGIQFCLSEAASIANEKRRGKAYSPFAEKPIPFFSIQPRERPQEWFGESRIARYLTQHGRCVFHLRSDSLLPLGSLAYPFGARTPITFGGTSMVLPSPSPGLNDRTITELARAGEEYWLSLQSHDNDSQKRTGLRVSRNGVDRGWLLDDEYAVVRNEVSPCFDGILDLIANEFIWQRGTEVSRVALYPGEAAGVIELFLEPGEWKDYQSKTVLPVQKQGQPYTYNSIHARATATRNGVAKINRLAGHLILDEKRGVPGYRVARGHKSVGVIWQGHT